MNILVLGGSGFVGQNLKNMISVDDNVLDFSRSNGCDLRDYKPSKDLIEDFEPDIIFNIAFHGGSLHYITSYSADVITDNTLMIANLYSIVNSLPKKPKIINPISNCSYPGGSDIQREREWLLRPVHESVFASAISKRILYYFSKCYFNQYGLNSINLIFPNAFGILDHTDPNKTHALDGMIIRMMEAKNKGDKEFEVWGTGKPIREWIYVEDFCKILLLSSSSYDCIIEPVNVSQSKGYSIKESVSIIKSLMSYDGDIVFNTAYQDGDPIKILDDAKFKSMFKDYKFTDHLEALDKTIQYYNSILG